MLTKGQYVRHKMARETLIGTIQGAEIQRGRVFYRFQQDTRLREPASALIRETSFSEDEMELCDGLRMNIGRVLTSVSLLAQGSRLVRLCSGLALFLVSASPCWRGSECNETFQH